ncbi:uncharacterized protein LOC128394593 [Panonychus citri]|uniref:uncharacterized protein LOC128394593 n=1 Tax=Panonychus citri TaxID=50023 RepID=UPI002307658B|nr:uncharacterized protein LOC128394593 [Panonychus citri]XP_053210909.1 uncharacterized protein LOC128394593 [Panonychus citri]
MISVDGSVKPRGRFADRAKAKLKAIKSVFSSRSSRLSKIGSGLEDISNTYCDTLITVSLLILAIVNAVFLYPIYYGGFLAVIYPDWMAPLAQNYNETEDIELQSANSLQVMVSRLNLISKKLATFCYRSSTEISSLCQK